MKRIVFTCLVWCISITIYAQLNMTELSNWECSNCIYNDIWGYVDDMENEYAVLGSRTKVHFVDVTDPATPVLKNEFLMGTNSAWRDMKSYDHYVYAVADVGTEGLAIFDMSSLPSGVITLASQNNSVFGKAHNIYIDAPSARLYVAGSDTQSSGVIIYSLADPLNPTVIANITLTGGYIHDVFVQNDTAYCSHGWNGMYIYDMANPTSPVLLANLNTGEYNHSSWITDDGSHLIYAEEVPAGLPMGMIDLSEININSLSITSTFSFPLLAPAHTDVTYHNPYIVDDYAIVSSYLDGITIIDISNPASPQLAAWYDTYPSNTNYNGGTGAWGVYPFFPSGNIIASDISHGLFVLSTTINLTTACNNGVMDEFETGIDCGGFCVPCANSNLAVDFEANITTGDSPLTVNFTELAMNEVSYQWDFDNDGNIDDTSPNPTYTYVTAGMYTVSLTVADALGNSLTETKTNYINVNAPSGSNLTVDFEADVTEGDAPLIVKFKELATNEISYQWDFDNDGNIDDTSPNPTHIYSNAGNYTVSLTVADAMGNMLTETKIKYIIVNASSGSNLTVDFNSDVTTGDAPLTVNFSELATNEVSYQWDFDNDGNIDDTNPNPNHTYATAGMYTVSLTVADALGNMLTETKTNYINVSSPEISCYEDLDDDSFGSTVEVSPVNSACPSGSVTNNTDCDDNNPNDTNIDVNATPIIGGNYFANAIVSSESNVIVGTTGVDKVTFQAGEGITLLNLFVAEEGSDFHALIDPNCPSQSSPLIEQDEQDFFNKKEKDKIAELDFLKIYPNPLQGETMLEYTLRNPSMINLFIMDAQGQVVERIINNTFTQKGIHQISYDASQISPSIYFLFLQTKNETIVQRMIVLKN